MRTWVTVVRMFVCWFAGLCIQGLSLLHWTQQKIGLVIVTCACAEMSVKFFRKQSVKSHSDWKFYGTIITCIRNTHAGTFAFTLDPAKQ